MKKFKKVRTVILVTVGLLIAANFLFHFYYQFQFNRRVEALAAEGYPVSLADLEKDYVLPEGAANAAEVYIEAFSHYQKPTEAEEEFLPFSGLYRESENEPPFPPEVMNMVEAYLDYNQLTLELLDEAAFIQYCLWPRTLNDYYYFNDHFSEIRKSILLLGERDLYLAQKGETGKVFDSLQTSIKLSQSLLKQPVLIDYLVCIAIKAMVARNLEGVLNQIEFTEAQLKQLQIQFTEMYSSCDLYQALINERCIMIVAYKLPFRKRYEYLMALPYLHHWPNVTKVLYLLSGFNQKDRVLSLEFYDRILATLQLPSHQRPPAIKMLDDEIDAYSNFRLNLIELSSLENIFLIDLRVIGNLRCAEVALAVERYRLAQGAVPGSLEALVPEFMEAVPLEPFDGEPLRYIRHEDDGYTVYTIGEDGVDNGGLSREQMAEQTGEGNPDEYDWPFTVRR